MTNVGLAHKTAANIYAQRSAVIRGISALKLTVLTLCSVGGVLAYNLLKPALINFSYTLSLSTWKWKIDENVLIEAILWVLLYAGFAARCASVSRLTALGRAGRARFLPFALALLPVVIFFVPLRIVAVNVIGNANVMAGVETVMGWLQEPVKAAVLILTALAVCALIALLAMAMKVFIVRVIINKQLFGACRGGKALKQGFAHCLSPLFVFLRNAFWLVCILLLSAEFAYLMVMQYSLDYTCLALGLLVLVGMWLCGFGAGFWGRYQVNLICLVRLVTDDDYVVIDR